MKETTFEEAMTKLQECARAIAGTDVPLEEAIASYEEGIAAYKQCKEILDSAEQKIQTIEEEWA